MPTSTTLSFRIGAGGDLVFDVERARLLSPAREVGLQQQQGVLLTLLATRPEVHLPKADIKWGVWGDAAISDESLQQEVRRLRRALREVNADHVRTHHGMGYELAVKAQPFGVPRVLVTSTLAPGFGRKVAATLAAFMEDVASWLLKTGVNVPNLSELERSRADAPKGRDFVQWAAATRRAALVLDLRGEATAKPLILELRARYEITDELHRIRCVGEESDGTCSSTLRGRRSD